MSQQSVTAVTLRATDYREDDKILTLFVPDRGLFTARLRGVKKARSRLKYAAEPFCYGVFELVNTRGGGHLITGCRAIEQFYELRQSITALYAGSVMIKFCLSFAAPDSGDYAALFKHLVTGLTLLKYGAAEGDSTGSEAEITAYFLLQAFSSCGYDLSRRLTLSYNKIGENIDIFNANPLTRADDTYLKNGAISCLYKLLQTPAEQVSGLKFYGLFNVRALSMLLQISEKVTEQRFNALREFINLIK